MPDQQAGFLSGICFIKLYFGDGDMEVKKFVKE